MRLKVARDHSLVDDLFSAGTLWIASLLRDPRDMEAAARVRDELSALLKEGGGDAEAAIREKLAEEEMSGLFAVQATRDAVKSAPNSRQSAALIDKKLMARAIALGLRLCGAVSGGYPGQNHEPASVEERGRAYDMLLSMVVELSRQVRESMLGSALREDAILSALGSYVRERTLSGGPGAEGPERGAPTHRTMGKA
jgi:hypothetical protein